MKKTMIIALFAVLVLSVFTACNGDVNEDLAGRPATTITFVLREHPSLDLTFEGGASELVVEVPEDCITWGDWIAKGYSVKVYYDGLDFWILGLMEYSDMTYFNTDGSSMPTTKITEYLKGDPYPASVGVDEEINRGSTYELGIFDT